jgi:hypothetical protein
MRQTRRIRTGVRRDDGIRVIRSNMPETHVTVHGLGSVRDTGLSLDGRAARHRRQKERARRRAIGWSIAIVAVLSLAAFGWFSSSERRAAADPITETTTSLTASPAHQKPAVTLGAARPIVPSPTPIFASYRSLQLRLPVAVKDLTEVGFHQAAYTYALHMATPLVEADNSDTKDAHGTGRETSTQPTGADAVLQGKFIRMWRSRPGKPDSAADVGAKAGADVFSPVTGTIVKIKKYKLYGQYDDYEIHIQPKGWSDIDLVMIHVTDLSATVGEEVVAGETRLAAVRKLSDRVQHQLREYTGDGGDHTHMQLNNAKDPRYKGLEGAIKVQP